MERGSARRKQAARWWNAEARESAVAQGSERVATPRLTSESVRGPHSRGPHAAEVLKAEGLAPPLSLSLAVMCAHAHVHVVQTIDTRRAWSTGIHEHQSINWALLVMVFTAEVLTRTEVLTAEERGPNTAIQGYFLTHACAANV